MNSIDKKSSEELVIDNYFSTGVGPFIYISNKDHKNKLIKAQTSSQLVSVLVENKIIDYTKKQPMKFYIYKDIKDALNQLDELFNS
ncbi:hypothetical protein [Clostridium tertium]|uniref:DUF5659 domain-containing protein n=1 Tax=Clostridium tertium TaxID=1559 RepID=A0A6N2YRF0_9CLOT